MSEENQAKLLRAYRSAIAEGQYGIADLLEDVLMGEMETERPFSTPRTFDDIPTTPITYSRHIATCEAGKGVELMGEMEKL